MKTDRLTDEMLDLLFDETSEGDAVSLQRAVEEAGDEAALEDYRHLLAEVRQQDWGTDVSPALHESILEIGRKGLPDQRAAATSARQGSTGFWARAKDSSLPLPQFALVASLLLTAAFVFQFGGQETIGQKFGTQSAHVTAAPEFAEPTISESEPVAAAAAAEQWAPPEANEEESVPAAPQQVAAKPAPLAVLDGEIDLDRERKRTSAPKAAKERARRAIRSKGKRAMSKGGGDFSYPSPPSRVATKPERSQRKKKSVSNDWDRRGKGSFDQKPMNVLSSDAEGSKLDDLAQSSSSAKKKSYRGLSASPSGSTSVESPVLRGPAEQAPAAAKPAPRKEEASAIGTRRGDIPNAMLETRSDEWLDESATEAAPSDAVAQEEGQATRMADTAPPASQSPGRTRGAGADMERAQKLYKSGRYQETVAESDRLLRPGGNADRAAVLMLKAQALMKLGRYEEADQALAEVQRSFPNYQSQEAERTRAKIRARRALRTKKARPSTKATVEEAN